MSRSRKGAKGPGFDYWSRRPHKSDTSGGGGPGYGPLVKRGTHRAERRQGNRIVRAAKD